MATEDLDTWDLFLRRAIDAALDHGIDATTLVDQLAGTGGLDAASLVQGMRAFWPRLLAGLPPGTVDPAFQHALTSVDFVPR